MAMVLLAVSTLAMVSTTALAQAKGDPPTTETLMKILDTEWQLAGVVGLDFMEVYLAQEDGISAETTAPVRARIEALRDRASKTLKATWGSFPQTWFSLPGGWPIEDQAEIDRLSAANSGYLEGECAKLVSRLEVYDALAGCSGAARSKIAKDRENQRRKLQHNAVVLQYHLATGQGGYMYDTSFDSAAHRSQKFAKMRAMRCTALEVQATCFNKREETALDGAALKYNYIANGRKVPLGRACVTGDGDACARLGELLRALSPQRASVVFGKACELGVARVCKHYLEYDWNQSRVGNDGVRLPRPDHYAKVLPLYEKSCDAGDLTACQQLRASYAQIGGCIYQAAKKAWGGADDAVALIANTRWHDRDGVPVGKVCDRGFAFALALAGAPGSPGAAGAPQPNRRGSSCTRSKDCGDYDNYGLYRDVCLWGECSPKRVPGRVERPIRLAEYDAAAKVCALDFKKCHDVRRLLTYRGRFILEEKLRTPSRDVLLELDKKPLDPDCKRAPCYPNEPTRAQRANMQKWAARFSRQCRFRDPDACTEYHLMMLQLIHAKDYGSWDRDSKHVSGLRTACYAGRWWACRLLTTANWK
jgi:hypothetical protein